jgi:hypothetical protein
VKVSRYIEKGGQGNIPLCAQEHIAAVDRSERHLHDYDVDEASEDLMAIRSHPVKNVSENP